METLVSLGAHCLLLLLDPVMANLPCFMVWSGCHLRSALCISNAALYLVNQNLCGSQFYLTCEFMLPIASPFGSNTDKMNCCDFSDGVLITCSGNYFQ